MEILAKLTVIYLYIALKIFNIQGLCPYEWWPKYLITTPLKESSIVWLDFLTPIDSQSSYVPQKIQINEL